MQGSFRSRSRSPVTDSNNARSRSPIGEVEEEMTEDQVIEARRRKREMLMKRLESESCGGSVGDDDMSGVEDDVLKKKRKQGEEEKEIADGNDSSNSNNSADNEGFTVRRAANESNSGASSLCSEDDMFSSNLGTKVDLEGKKLDQSLLDNWDDIEGYYRVISGELIINRYLVTKTLGRGVFAAVVRAEDQISKTTVAIKIIRNNETMRTAGQKEIEILKTLNSADRHDDKHVVRLLDSFDFKNHLCLVFENLGSNLREVLNKFGRGTGINIRAIRSYAYQALKALDLLQQCQIVHADLKPDNMLVDESHKKLKLADLGSAIHISDEALTPYLVSRFYRAPELILGISYDYGVDMWSLGCSLFELYSGNILFNGRNNNQMLQTIMESRGMFSHKLLRKGKFTDQHFNDRFAFISHQVDKVTEKPVEKLIGVVGPFPEKTIFSLLNGMENDYNGKTMLSRFIDLIDKMLVLNPDKRITPKDALEHPFIVGE